MTLQSNRERMQQSLNIRTEQSIDEMVTTDLPEYLSEKYRSVFPSYSSHTIKVRRWKDGYIAFDMDSKIAVWGASAEEAVYTLGRTVETYQQKNTTSPRTIVTTDGVLGGDPRIDDTRIGVEHIVNASQRSNSLAEIAAQFQGPITTEEISLALQWADEHSTELQQLAQKREKYRQYAEEVHQKVSEGVYYISSDSEKPSFEEWKQNQ